MATVAPIGRPTVRRTVAAGRAEAGQRRVANVAARSRGARGTDRQASEPGLPLPNRGLPSGQRPKKQMQIGKEPKGVPPVVCFRWSNTSTLVGEGEVGG